MQMLLIRMSLNSTIFTIEIFTNIIAVYDTLYNYVQTILATFKLTTLNYLVELILIVNNGNQRCFLTFKSKMFINLLTTPMQYHFSSCGVCNVMIFLSDIYRDPHGDLNLFEPSFITNH